MSNYKFDTFLSYSRKDKDFVEKLQKDLVNKGITIWWDNDCMNGGAITIEEIGKGIKESRTMCIVVSPDSINSGWVKQEYQYAFNLSLESGNQRRIIPLIFKKADLPFFLANYQWVDFSDSSKYSERLDYLAKGIKYINPLPQGLERPKNLEEMLRTAKNSLIISGHTLDKFTEQVCIKKALLDAINNNIKVTLILVNPFCDSSRAHEPFHMLESRSPAYEQITNSISELNNMLAVTNYSKKLTVLLSNYMPRFRTIIIDNVTIHISLYMYGIDVDNVPEITLIENGEGMEQNWFKTIMTSTEQLILSRNVIPVIRDGFFHHNWESSRYAFQMSNCLAKSCCISGTNYWSDFQNAILGYQNDDGGRQAISQYHLVDINFVPGLFMLSEISKGAKFLAPRTNFDEWLEDAVCEELRLIKTTCPTIPIDIGDQEIISKVKHIFNFKKINGKTLRELTCYQEYSDILHRIIMTLIANYPEFEIELYKNITVNQTQLILDIIRFLEEKGGYSLQDWLHFSIAAGLLGIDSKTVNAATSAFNKTLGIQLSDEIGKHDDTVRRIANELVTTANTPNRIDATNFFFHILDTNNLYPLKIVSFPDDYLESLFLLKFYELLLDRYKTVSIDFIPKSVPCSNDLTYDHTISLMKFFPRLAKNNRRFQIVANGPKTGGVNILKLNDDILKRMANAFLIDVRGARNYEMMQGIKKQTFFGFMVCRDFSASVSGLIPKDRPLVFIRHIQGERSFEGFKQRYLRPHSSGHFFARKVIADDTNRWSGGHIFQIAKSDERYFERWRTLVKFYSNNALDFHRKWGNVGEIEDDVKANLDKLVGRILVLGCGSGKEVAYLTEKKQLKNVFGLDFSSEAILIARQNYPHLRENFFVEDFYNIDRVLNGEFDSIVANASLLHILDREHLKLLLEKIRLRLKKGGLLFVRLINKRGHVHLDLDDPSLRDLITKEEKALLLEYVQRGKKNDSIDINDIMPLYQNGSLSIVVFDNLLSKARPLKEEIDGLEKGEDRWFVYFEPKELCQIAQDVGYSVRGKIEIHPHHKARSVKWLSALLEKS